MTFKSKAIASLIHFATIIGLFSLMTFMFDYYILEIGILVILMYEIGFKLDFIDDLIEWNGKFINTLNRCLKGWLNPSKRKRKVK
ncbi:MAG: hypothetical protein E2O29_02215 [Deltaproteobacteria bacterium]|nr:MAG: hypothetical protein E2O29_02215 [Deltaproteobacteria bacterium]